ncbi:MAG: DUF1801 domain-containing protein [Candidatus Cloacimonetes bacterium]|nr:DUF1801 domain-containing protein [Candidatus Cloacimonadota bacterium]
MSDDNIIVKKNSVDDYIQSFDGKRQSKLSILRYIISEEIPEAEERLVMGIPTYYFHGKLFSFAGQKGHYYFYPGRIALETYADDLEGHILGRNTLSFSYDKPIPEETIKLIIRYRVLENMDNKSE